MSKENLEKLNESLVQHFKETGVKNAYYYAPLFDYYWNQPDKIGICNLEPYSNDNGDNLLGIKKVDDKVIVDYWYNAPTIQRTLKIFQLITKKIETEADVSEKDLAACDNKKVDEVVTKDLGASLYFNFRLTVGNGSSEHSKEIIDFYKDPFYQNYYKNFVKETELGMLIVTGETGCKVINMLYPDLNLEYRGAPKKSDGVLFCSMPHPTARNYSNEELIKDLNEFFDYYWAN